MGRGWRIALVITLVIEAAVLFGFVTSVSEVVFPGPERTRTFGRVIDSDYNRAGTTLLVRFRTRSGTIEQGWTAPGLPAHAHVGDQVTVEYDPARPDDFDLTTPRWLPGFIPCLLVWSLVTWAVWRAAREKRQPPVSRHGRHSPAPRDAMGS